MGMNGTNLATANATNGSCDPALLAEEALQLEFTEPWFWGYFGIFVFLMLFAGLMSGLTLGLLSLDPLHLNVVCEGGTPKQQKYAKKLLPLVNRHHLLLVTLLLANAAAVESMPLCLDRISSPVIAICVSTTAVLFIGEIIPQAVCSRYGLAIGAHVAPLVYFLVGLFFIIGWPLSKLLDLILGKDSSTFFRRSELKVLIDLHGKCRRTTMLNMDPKLPVWSSTARRRSGADSTADEELSADEVTIIKGALEMTRKTARDAMINIDQVFMVSIDDKLDMEMLCKLTHSRIPIYEGDRNNIVSMLIVKALLTLLPEERLTVRQLATTPAVRPIPAVTEDMPLYDLLNQFQLGTSHLALVKKGDEVEEIVVGIITLEDIIEELIQEEILDEADNAVQYSRGNLLSLMMAVGKQCGSSTTILNAGVDRAPWYAAF